MPSFSEWIFAINSSGLFVVVIWGVTAWIVYLLIKKKMARIKLLKAGLILILLFNMYSVFTLNGNVRLLIAATGHPVVAYETKRNNIEIQMNSYFSYDVEFRSGKTDKYGFKIAPLTIRTYRIGFFYYSYYLGNG